MTPYQIAAQWCKDHPHVMPFAEQLAHYGKHGFIWSSPTAFVLASYHQGLDGDEWFVGLAAGCMPEFLAHAPWPAKWVCYEREGKLRRHSFQRLLSRLTLDKVIPPMVNHGKLTKETGPAAESSRAIPG